MGSLDNVCLDNVLTNLSGFFNNASVAAFVGAVCGGLVAVATVAFTDRLRDRRTLKTIQSEIASAKGHAEGKLETVRAVLQLFREKQQIRAGEILRFDVAVVRELKARVLHLLEPRQRQALDAVLFRMEGTDALLDEARQQEEAFRPPTGWQVHIVPAQNQVAQLDSLLDAIIVNLKVLIEMAGNYASGDYASVTQKQYRLRDYAEPGSESAKE